MEGKSNKHTIFPKGAVVGFDFEKMVVLKSNGYSVEFKGIPSRLVCYMEPITEKEREQLVDYFHDCRAAGRT